MSQVKTVITRNANVNYLFDIVSMEFSKDGQTVQQIIKQGITLEKAQEFFGINPNDSYIDSEGDRI